MTSLINRVTRWTMLAVFLAVIAVALVMPRPARADWGWSGSGGVYYGGSSGSTDGSYGTCYTWWCF